MTEQIRNAKILIVDDDPVSLKLSSLILSKETSYDIYQGKDAEEGLQVARDILPDIIISDYYMPGKNGLEFCREIKGDPSLYNAIFILLTAETDIVKKVEGLDEGADDYIEKTVSSSVLLSKVKAFLRIKNLQNELTEEKKKLQMANDLLELNFRELIAILLKILEVNIPGASDRAQVSKKAAGYIADKLGIVGDEKRHIIFGAMMHEIGKIGVVDNFLKSKDKTPPKPNLDAYRLNAATGSIIVSTISGFKSSRYDIYHQYENYDGSGTPDKLMGNEISIGSRIIRAIIFQEELFTAGHSTEDVLEAIHMDIGKSLDPVVAAYMSEFLIENNKTISQNKKKITLEELEAGMIIAEDIYASSGTKLLTKDVQIKDWMLHIITKRNLTDPVIGGIYVYNDR